MLSILTSNVFGKFSSIKISSSGSKNNSRGEQGKNRVSEKRVFGPRSLAALRYSTWDLPFL